MIPGAKVAMVEDFSSELQEVLPASRRRAFRKSGLGQEIISGDSDAGTVDSGYSSTSAPNGQEVHDIYPEADSPSRHTPQSDLSDSNISERTPVNRPLGLETEGRASRASNPHRASGRYAFVPGGNRIDRLDRIERPLSRSASKRDSTGRASPAIRPQDADECDCPHCAKASGSAQPSPSLPPPDAGLEGPWSLDMSNSLPSYNPSGLDYSSGLLGSSPGRTRGRENNGFFETFPTSTSTSTADRRSSSLLSSSNPLGGLSTSYEYTASPSTYTPQSAMNPLISPPPYLGVDEPWVPPPSTPTSLRGRDHANDYMDYSNDYMYGNPSGAASANGGNVNHTGYDLPPRSASVQPSGLRNRPRSSTYHVEYPMGPPQRRSSKAPTKRIHSATNSYDGRYDTPVPYNYDSTYDTAATDDFHAPAPPINRRLSRAGPSALPPLDITRATSVPPADNYLVGIDRARRMTSVTPQPLAITNNRDRNRRGSNASSGLSSSASRRAQEAQARMNEMIDSVKVEPRPELALAKRDSTGGAVVKHGGYNAVDYDYATEGTYGGYEYPYDHSGMDAINPYHHDELEQDALVLSGHSETFSSSRYGLPPKLHYAGGDPLHRSLRMSSDRRRSMHRRFSDYQHGADPYNPDLDELRQLTKSRNSGFDRRLGNPAYIEDNHGY